MSGAEALPGSSFIDFDRWTEKYFAESSDEARLVLESEGDSLAQARRRDLARVIESDPERAIRLAVPVNLRHRLPPSISRHLEERVSARAKYEVIGVLGIPEDPLPRTTIERRVTFKDKTYRAFVYGRRLQQTTKESIPIHGIAVGDALAVHESAVRALEPGESPDPSLAVGNRDGHCPVSKQAADSAVAVESGGEIFYLCRAGHIAAFSQALEEEAMAIGPAIHKQAADAAEVSWTRGVKRVLFMRVIFSDAPDASISEAAASELMRQANDFFVENSYGATSLSTTVTPLLLVPKPASWYATNRAAHALLDDARQAAAATGYGPGDFELDCVHFHVAELRNQANVGDKGAWLRGTDVGTVCHELGHNFGLRHANAWVTTDGSVIGSGRNQEYGDVFDTMGYGDSLPYDFNAFNKHRLDWLADDAVQTVTTNGVYRLYPSDTGPPSGGLSYALRIQKDSERDYWIETRRQLTSQPGAQLSLLVYWSPWSLSLGGSQLLDMTPGSEGGHYDAPLLLGRSFFDPTLGLKITPFRLGGTTPESIDVMITHVSAPPRLAARKEPGGECTLTLTGGAVGSYVIEATSDLANWEAIGTLMTPTGNGQITDRSAHDLSQRFYRAVPK